MKYKDKIKSFEVKKVTYQIIQYEAPGAVTTSATASYIDASPGLPEIEVAEITNLNLKTAFDNATITQLEVADSNLQLMAKC